MVTFAACYPGQGAQKPKMALDLHAKSAQVAHLFSIASEASGKDMLSLLGQADETALQQTEITQVAITLANRSAYLVLQEQGIVCGCHAGFSLGELSAYAGAGVFDDETLFRVVAKRGELMAQASEHAKRTYGQLGMAAVVGIGFDAVEQVLEQMKSETLFCANDNGPRQVVLSGTATEISRCEDALKAAGARRIIPLKVSGPFHTPFMNEAVDAFSEFLETILFSDPTSALYVNVTGDRVTSGAAVREACAHQLSSPVRWTRIMHRIVEDEGIEHALEIGPGSVLGGLWRSSGLSVGCAPAGTYEAIRNIGKEGTL